MVRFANEGFKMCLMPRMCMCMRDFVLPSEKFFPMVEHCSG